MGQAQQKNRAVLIVEDDAELRGLTAALLEDGELDTIECESAEAALATMLLRGQDVTMIFADIGLSGVMDGIDLAREVKMRWPHLMVILTSGNAGERLEHLPPGVDYMPKPWQHVRDPVQLGLVASRTRITGLRSKTTKARTHVDRVREPRPEREKKLVELEKKLHARTRELTEAHLTTRTCSGAPPTMSTRFCAGRSQATSQSSSRPNLIWP